MSNREAIVGLTGLALCRSLISGPPDQSRSRIEELRASLTAEDADWDAAPLPELDPSAGYALWATVYDLPGNQLIVAEEAIVRPLLDQMPAGRALDAACGTGRHAAYLALSGHEVVGVDSSDEMLSVARERVAGSRFHRASIERLPFPDEQFDLVVCSLALTHLPRLDQAIAELARVVRPGGRMVLSDIHPTCVIVLDGQARFRSPDGNWGFVRNHVHLHADYLAAFRQASLRVLNCVDAIMRYEDVQAQPFYPLAPKAVADAMVGLPYLLVWDLVRDSARNGGR